MISVLKNSERGHTQTSWLDSLHSFSFGSFWNPDQMGYGPLRVINDDRVMPEAGFSLHRHANMEIITYVLSGTLAHRDSLGSGSHIKRGDIQRMTAGTGIQHSEFNPSMTEKVHLLQIWIQPKVQDLPPSYEQKFIPVDEFPNRFVMIASPDGREDSITINQDVILYACVLEEEEAIHFGTSAGAKYWLHVVSGEALLNESTLLKVGDGAAIEEESTIVLMATQKSEFLLFEIK